MRLYVISKKEGHWSNGSSKEVLLKLCERINLKETLIYDHGKPLFSNSTTFLSISHSDKVMVIAFSAFDIGIDIEKNKVIKKDVIERVNLDSSQPLLDWCRREATIKLYNDSNFLFIKEPKDTLFSVEDVYNGFTCVIASKNISPVTIIYHLNEEDI